MAKKSRDSKAQPAKMPKEIAGVKVGRDLRDAVEPLLRLASNPLVSDVLSAALLAGADTLAGKKKTDGNKGDNADSPIAAAIGAATSSKGKGPLELLLAIAAGEIASKIVAAYGPGRVAKGETSAARSEASAPPKPAKQKKRQAKSAAPARAKSKAAKARKPKQKS